MVKSPMPSYKPFTFSLNRYIVSLSSTGGRFSTLTIRDGAVIAFVFLGAFLTLLDVFFSAIIASLILD